MPCYHCGTRQVDPDRGASPWTRGVLHDHQILVCPVCQAARDWAAELDRCDRCGSAHLVRRLDEVECRDCGLTWLAGTDQGDRPGEPGRPRPGEEPAAEHTGTGQGHVVIPVPGTPDPELAAEVEQALARVLGRNTDGTRRRTAGAGSGRPHW
ncbi:MAG TPA: hypothetical protein VKV33_04140 [Streptosporangiaceae bacterium]|nr:hypothetical protein [Streptosporangiaceae bacterium]